jgi:hypothetical protein
MMMKIVMVVGLLMVVLLQVLVLDVLGTGL